MRRNALIHHKRNHQNNFLNSKLHSQIRDSIIENPENSAKFCLLQISEEAQRSNNRTFSSFQNHQLRSFSTELFTQKKAIIEKQKVLNEKNCVQSGRYRKQELKQSVTLKSTFSNDMRKITQIHLFKKNEKLPDQLKSYQSRESNSGEKSLSKFRKVNYLPLVVPEQKQIEKIDEIFHNAPSRKILAILKRANIAKEIQQNDKEFMQKQQSQEKFPVRKKSIFSIRHLMMKEKNAIGSARKEKESSELKGESPQCFQLKEQHSNNYNVVKLRLKNRRNFTALENK